MQALTVTQPWATFCVARPAPLESPLKPAETRSWRILPKNLPPNPIAIHAGKGIDRLLRANITTRDRMGTLRFREPYASALLRLGYSDLDPWQKSYEDICPANLKQLPLSAIIGTVRVALIAPTDIITRLWMKGRFGDLAYALGDFSAGRFAWILREQLELREPIPCSGSRGLWLVRIPTEHAIENTIRG
jgi:hypothetical protein